MDAMSTNQHTLAEQFGVSQVTVSRALRNRPGVRRELRAAIREAAQRAGYRLRRLPNRETRAEPAARTRVLCADVTRGVEFNEAILDGICLAAREGGAELIVAAHAENPLPLVVSRRQVDGLVRLLGDKDFERGFAMPAPVPTVSILFNMPDADVVSVDHFSSARRIGVHLASLGHRIVAFVGIDTPISKARLAGIRSGLEEGGGWVPPELVRLSVRMGMEAVGPAVDGLLGQRSASEPERRFTAIACYNDYMALYAIQRLRERGVQVPGEMSVTGYDGIAPPILPEVRLTTIELPLVELGAEAVRCLRWRLQNPDAPLHCRVLETHLIVGETVAPCRGQGFASASALSRAGAEQREGGRP